MEQQLSLPLDICPPAGESGRRRTRTAAVKNETLACRRDRINKRNRILTARYYYWTELRRRRFDDVVKILSDNEFFVEDRTISNTLLEQDAFYTALCREKATCGKLRKMFPGFAWD